MRCTSFGPRWRNTSAASLSPSDISKIAALSTKLRFDGVSAGLVDTVGLFIALYSLIVFVDPGFYYLSDPARVISHEPFTGIQLLLVTFVRSGQAGDGACEGDSGSGAVAVAAQAGGFQGGQLLGFLLLGHASAGSSQTLQHRPQQTKDKHQNNQYTGTLL